MSITIRPETQEDHAAIWKVHRAAFKLEIESNLVDALRTGGFVEVSLVAESGGEIVGHILFHHLSVVTKDKTAEVLSLAPMSVLPDLQRQGIGSKLIKAGIEACRESCYRIITVLGHPAYYTRFEFSAELAQSLESPFGGGEAWMAMELKPGAIAKIKGRVKYPPPFDKIE